MNIHVLESLEVGSHGIIPDEGINYFVGQNRITVHKDGKKVIDKEIDINPDGTISKYNLICDDDKDPELKPVTDVEEFNVANMLPQVVPEGSVLRKESDDDTDATDEVVTESVAGTILLGATVVLTGGLIAYEAKKLHDEKKAIDWYAEEYNVEPKFSELTRKNYKVKYTHRTHDIDMTDKEKRFNIDHSNVAEVYSYKGEKAFCILYGNKIDWVESLSATAITNIILIALGSDSTSIAISSYHTIKVLLYDEKFRKELKYYAAKAMIKHSTSLPSVDKWTKEVTKKYKAAKKAMKESELSMEDLSNDLDTILENCNNILDRISPYNETEESTIDESDDIVIAETAADCVANLTEKRCDSIMKKYRSYCAKEIRKVDDVASVEEGNYKGWSINIKFKKKDMSEITKLAREEIVPILNKAMNDFTKEYKSQFYWNDKVFTEDGLLVTLDSDIYYDYKESTEVEEAAKPIDVVKHSVKKASKLAKSELNKIEKLASEKANLFKDLKHETNKLKKNDIKKKLVKNQKEFRDLLKGLSPDHKKKVNKFYGGINHHNYDTIHINNFMDQMRRDNETAMRAHQQAMDMHNQADMMHQQMMFNNQMMGMM